MFADVRLLAGNNGTHPHDSTEYGLIFLKTKPHNTYIENQIVESEDILIDSASKVAAESLGVNWL